MFCQQAKAYLSEKGGVFPEKNKVEDPAALEDLQALKRFTTPVLKIGDEVIVGFDGAVINRKLAKAGS